MRIQRLVNLNTFSLSCTYCTAAQRGDKKKRLYHHGHSSSQYIFMPIKISQSNYRQKKRWSKETRDDSLMIAVCNMEKLNYYRNIQSKKLRKFGRKLYNLVGIRWRKQPSSNECKLVWQCTVSLLILLGRAYRSPDKNKVNVCLPFCFPGDLNDLDVVQTHTQRPTV